MLRWVQVLPINLKAQFSELVRSQAKALVEASSVDEIFMIISPYWNSLHPTLLEYLVKKLEDGELDTRMRQYMEKLREFRVCTKLGKFIDKWTGGIPPGFNEFVLKLGEEWREKTIEDLEQFRISLSRQRCFDGHMAYVKKASTGCIALVFALPQCCFPLKLEKDSLDFLKENHVLQVLVDSICVFNLEEKFRLWCRTT